MSEAAGFPMLAPELADTMTGMAPDSFDALYRAETTHFWFRCRARLIAGLVARHFPNACRYLEIGCGNGAVLAEIAALRPWTRLSGTELHPSGLRHARERLGPEADLLQLDARRIPLRETFDLAGAYDVLEHIEEDEAVLGALHAALRPGAGLVLSVPQHPALWSASDEIALHRRRYRRGELEEKAARAGFRVIASTSYIVALLPLLLLSRRRLPPGTKLHDVMAAEFAIHPSANTLLGRITGAEVALSLRGVSWPFGGSRVVVCVRD